MESFSQDPYVILDIPRDATEGRIRRAYRRLAMKFHPDRNPDDPEAEERFKQVQWAYESLTGRKGQEGISSVTFKQGHSATPFSESTRPFYGFFWAVKAFYAKKEDSIEGSSHGGKEDGGSNFPQDR